MNQRWYDHDPTVSMAVSLLLNDNKRDQQRPVHYILNLLERDEVFAQFRQHIGDPLRITYLFPNSRRRDMASGTRRLLEILKLLPYSIQLDMSLNMINYIYLLDAGMAMNDQELDEQADYPHPEAL